MRRLISCDSVKDESAMLEGSPSTAGHYSYLLMREEEKSQTNTERVSEKKKEKERVHNGSDTWVGMS